MPDVVDLILADHREVERLIDLLEKEPDQRRLVLPTLATLLTAHSRAEEAEVYPAARDEVGETHEVAHSQEEHARAEQLLVRLQAIDPASAKFQTALKEFVHSLTHHLEEEEATVLPGMKKRLSAARRDELARAFAASREEHLGDRPGDATRDELLRQAQNADVEGASSMSKDELTKKIEDM